MEPLNRASDDEDPRTKTEDVDYDSDMGSDSSNSFPEGIGEVERFEMFITSVHKTKRLFLLKQFSAIARLNGVHITITRLIPAAMHALLDPDMLCRLELARELPFVCDYLESCRGSDESLEGHEKRGYAVYFFLQFISALIFDENSSVREEMSSSLAALLKHSEIGEHDAFLFDIISGLIHEDDLIHSLHALNTIVQTVRFMQVETVNKVLPFLGSFVEGDNSFLRSSVASQLGILYEHCRTLSSDGPANFCLSSIDRLMDDEDEDIQASLTKSGSIIAGFLPEWRPKLLFHTADLVSSLYLSEPLDLGTEADFLDDEFVEDDPEAAEELLQGKLQSGPIILEVDVDDMCPYILALGKLLALSEVVDDSVWDVYDKLLELTPFSYFRPALVYTMPGVWKLHAEKKHEMFLKYFSQSFVHGTTPVLLTWISSFEHWSSLIDFELWGQFVIPFIEKAMSLEHLAHRALLRISWCLSKLELPPEVWQLCESCIHECIIKWPKQWRLCIIVIDMLKVFWNQAYAAGTVPSTSINDFAELFYHKVHAVHQEALKQFPCCVDVLAPNDREVLKERLSPNKYAGGQNRYDGPFSHRIFNNTVLELIHKHL